jgi:hypothetical protein
MHPQAQQTHVQGVCRQQQQIEGLSLPKNRSLLLKNTTRLGLDGEQRRIDTI